MKARGFALILVIWVLVLLSLLAAGFSALVRVESEAGSWLSDQTQLQAVASAAVHRAMLGISVHDKELRWQADAKPRTFHWNGQAVQIVIRSESGKLDINYAPRLVLLGLLQQVGGNADSDALIDALIDWRDRDNQTSPHGAEAADYQAAGLRHVPSNGPLTSISELSQVMGFSGELVQTLRPFITVYARRPKIDVNSAPLQVIAALPGIDRATAEQFVLARAAAQSAEQTPDLSLLSAAKRYFDARTGSGVFNIEVSIPFEGYRHREQAVVRLQSGSGDYEILSWETLAHTDSDNNP